jgi:hypothetical protein
MLQQQQKMCQLMASFQKLSDCTMELRKPALLYMKSSSENISFSEVKFKALLIWFSLLEHFFWQLLLKTFNSSTINNILPSGMYHIMGDSGCLGCDAILLDQQFLMKTIRNYLSSITSQMTRISKTLLLLKSQTLQATAVRHFKLPIQSSWHGWTSPLSSA